MTEAHVSTKDRPGDFDGFETAKPGEPIFTLQGGDPIAAVCVMFWAWKARQLARVENTPEKRRVLLIKKAGLAEEVAWAMRDYRRGESEVEGVRAGYSEDSPASTAEQISERAALIANVGVLNNAVALIKDVEEALAARGLFPPEQGALLSAIEAVRAVAASIEPRREGDRS